MINILFSQDSNLSEPDLKPPADSTLSDSLIADSTAIKEKFQLQYRA
jgi:hypothetical protein